MRRGHCIHFQYSVYFHRTVKGIYTMKANELITLFMKRLPALLPPDFTLEEGEREVSAGQHQVDIQARLRTPTRAWPIVIEVKNADRIASIRQAASQVKHFAQIQHAIPF